MVSFRTVPTLSESFFLHPRVPPVASVCVRAWDYVIWLWGSETPRSMYGSLFLLTSPLFNFCACCWWIWPIHLVCWGPDVSAYRLNSTLVFAGTTDLWLIRVWTLTYAGHPTATVEVHLHPSTWQPCSWLSYTQLSFHQMLSGGSVHISWFAQDKVSFHCPEIYLKHFFHFLKWSTLKYKFKDHHIPCLGASGSFYF